jgi:hypothetical protein
MEVIKGEVKSVEFKPDASEPARDVLQAVSMYRWIFRRKGIDNSSASRNYQASPSWRIPGAN